MSWKSIASRIPAFSGGTRLCRRTWRFTFAIPQASHSTVEIPLIFTPRDWPTRCLSASGPGCPSRRCQKVSSPLREGRLVHESYCFRLARNAAAVVDLSIYSSTYWSKLYVNVQRIESSFLRIWLLFPLVSQ